MTGSNPRRHDGDGGIGDPTTSAPDREVRTGFKPWILLVAAAALTLVACTEEPAEPSGARVGEPPAQFAEPSTRGPPIAADVRKQIALLQQHEDGLARRQARRVRDLFREVEEGIFYLPDADVGPLMTPAGPSGIRQPLSVMEAGIRSKLESPVPRGDISVDRQIGKTLCACWSLPAATRGARIPCGSTGSVLRNSTSGSGRTPNATPGASSIIPS